VTTVTYQFDVGHVSRHSFVEKQVTTAGFFRRLRHVTVCPIVKLFTNTTFYVPTLTSYAQL